MVRVPKPRTAESAQASSGPSLALRVFAASVVAALVLVIAVLALQILSDERDADRNLEQARLTATAAASRLAADAEGLRRLLQSVAVTLPEPLGGPEAKAVLDRTQGSIGRHIRLRAVPAGLTDPDPTGPIPVSYSTLELLRQAERGVPTIPAEMHQVGTAEMHVAVAVPVAGAEGRAPRGLLIAALPGSVVQQSIDTLGRQAARIEVIQKVAGRSVTVAVDEGAAPAQGPAAGSVEIPGTILEVAYWPMPVGTGGWVLAAAIGGAAVLLVLGVGGVWATWVQRAYAADGTVVVNAVRDLARFRKHGSSQPTELAETADLLQALQTAEDRRAVPRNGTTRSTPPPPTPEPATTEPPTVPKPSVPAAPTVREFSESVFRAYDIRGVYGETLDVGFAYELGRAIGSQVFERGEQQVAVGRDGRPSSQPLAEALIRGLVSSGREVVDIGLVPTPVLYFAAIQLGSGCGVMVTGSHNPGEYNGFKLMIGGETPPTEQIRALRDRMMSGDVLRGAGTHSQHDFVPEYVQRIVEDVHLIRPIKIVVDAGNGAAGNVAPELFRQLGCEVFELYCEVDGQFPNHHPDPSQPRNLQDLMVQVRALNADLGIAFDGDGDRLGVVDGRGRMVWPDHVLMLLAGDVLMRNPGADILFDVKSSRHLATYILSGGGRPVMWKSGHSLMKAKMRETGALLGGEFSGHVFFKERWYGFDDALYAAARLLEVLASESRTPDELFDDLPISPATPELHVDLTEGANFVLMRRLMELADFPDARIINLDGLRVEFEDGWGLVRPSNTTPSLVFRFEGEDEAALERIKGRFRALLNEAAPYLTMPF
jgi:phosphomannomutase/phosphoglucomutase